MLDKLVSAVTPLESDEKRAQARSAARSVAEPDSWFATIIDQHEQIERAFERTRTAQDAQSQREAQQELALILNGHAMAEEVVIYPALVAAGDHGHAGTAYTQHTGAKVQMGELELLPPLSREYLEKLDHIRGAVLHHIYQEESSWLQELQRKASSAENQRLTRRFDEEFERYAGGSDASVFGRGTSGRRSESAGIGAPGYQS